MNLTKIILVAQKRLIENSVDLAHDIMHHYRVVEFSLKIRELERNDCDEKTLIIAGWFHDIVNRDGSNILAVKAMLAPYIKDKRIDNIIASISEHSYKKKQNTDVSKILYDADKLEYVNLPRLKWLLQIHEDHYISEKKFIFYVSQWFRRISKIHQSLHFNSSKKMFHKMESEAYKIMEKARKMTRS